METLGRGRWIPRRASIPILPLNLLFWVTFTARTACCDVSMSQSQTINPHVITHHADPYPTERPLYWHYPNTYGQAPYSSVRVGDWELIFHDTERKTELFNLNDDISEARNVANLHPKKVEQLMGKLTEFLIETKAQMPLDNTTGDPVPIP